MAELEAEKTPAGFKHAAGLLKGIVDARHVPEAESNGVHIKGFVGKGQFFGIAFDPVEIVEDAAVKGAGLAYFQHGTG
jgi:hypothetical protein